MMIFPITILFLFLLILWQLVVYVRTPQGIGLRKLILVRLLSLMVVLGFLTYAWQTALSHQTRFLSLILPYPDARLDILRTPIFSDHPYWTYVAPATGDQIFNWYRSRAKHAGWSMADEGIENARVFAIRLDPKNSLFVVLEESEGETVITYTAEGEVVRKTVSR